MVAAHVDDGQELLALNEIYLGQPTHQTARYSLRWDDVVERQASSGLLVGTGTGATGWCLSAWQGREHYFQLPGRPRASWRGSCVRPGPHPPRGPR
ncbi:MAG: hypothetical protein R2734_13130 [Nocardioides sp.]